MSLLRARTYRPERVHAEALASVPPELPADLATSALAQYARPSLELLRHERAAGEMHGADFWVAVVPGASEQWGHHRAPPAAAEARGTLVSDEYFTRLHRGFRLLRDGVVRSLILSGGSIDPMRPDFNEALRGREVIERTFSTEWDARRGPLRDRLILDPLALHSTTNLRNAARLCVQLAIDRVLIVTTMPPTPLLWPVLLPVLFQTSQGWYFLHHRLSTFDWRCRRELGYSLGAFDWYESRRDDRRTTGIVLHDFAVDRLLADRYGP